MKFVEIVLIILFFALIIYMTVFYKKGFESKTEEQLAGYEKAYFSGGCFWCVESPFQESDGVVDAVSGYIGGEVLDASYKKVLTGATGHRESVMVSYDPEIVSFAELTEIFWRQIDPTDAGGQFADRGYHYTTALYYQNEEEKRILEESKKSLSESGKFESDIVTEILSFTEFFRAEEYHQDYYKKSSDHYERYKEGSGRTGFIKENWAKEAAIKAIEEDEE